VRKHLLGALAVFAASCVYLMVGVKADGDTVGLLLHGNGVVHGQLPYRDFALEYPPGSIPLFTIPAWISEHDYATIYRVENAIGWLVVVVLVSLLVREAWPVYAAALTPFALGPFFLMRFDAWAVAFALGALVAIVRGRTTLALSLLALGTLVKVWPLLLVPVFLLYRWSRRALLAFLAVVTATLLPFVILAPVGSYNALRWQTNRHLQLETLGSSVLLALGRPVHTFADAGSVSIGGSGADAIGLVQSLLELALVVLVALLFARSRRTRDDLLVAVLATVAVSAIVGKVLSPQYLIWLAPFAVLVPAILLPYAIACLLTRALFPGQYGGLIDQHDGPIALLVVRNAVLVALVVLSLRAVWLRRVAPLAVTRSKRAVVFPAARG
jgi:hypothetical protein